MVGIMSIMGIQGDKKVTWDTDKPETIEEAMSVFDGFVKNGPFVAFGDDGGTTGRRMTAFDPTEKNIVLAPIPIVG